MKIGHTFEMDLKPGDLLQTIGLGECMVYAVAPDKITLCSVNVIGNTNIHELTPAAFFKLSPVKKGA